MFISTHADRAHVPLLAFYQKQSVVKPFPYDIKKKLFYVLASFLMSTYPKSFIIVRIFSDIVNFGPPQTCYKEHLTAYKL